MVKRKGFISRFSDEERLRYVHRYLLGDESQKEIAMELSISVATFGKWCKELRDEVETEMAAPAEFGGMDTSESPFD